MKKAIIVEKTNEYTVVMTSDGTFRKIASRSTHATGGEVRLRSKMGTAAVMLSVLFLLCSVFFAFPFIRQPDAVVYLSLDINPTVSMTLNQNGKILSIDANESGYSLLVGTELIGQDAATGMRKVVELATRAGYLEYGNEDNAMLLTVAGTDDEAAQKLRNRVSDNIFAYLDGIGIMSVMLTSDCYIPAEHVKIMNEFGISASKLALIEAAASVDRSVTLENGINMSVKNLIKKIQKNQVSIWDMTSKDKFASLLQEMIDENKLVFNSNIRDFQSVNRDEYFAKKALWTDERMENVFLQPSFDWQAYKRAWEIKNGHR